MSLGIDAFCPEPGLRSLAEGLAARVAEHSPLDHDPFGAVAKMVRKELFTHVVPEAYGGALTAAGEKDTLSVRALCLVLVSSSSSSSSSSLIIFLILILILLFLFLLLV